MIVMWIVLGLLAWCLASVAVALFLGASVRLRDRQVPSAGPATGATPARLDPAPSGPAADAVRDLPTTRPEPVEPPRVEPAEFTAAPATSRTRSRFAS